MSFLHVRGVQLFWICSAALWVKLSRLGEELNKCDVLCLNCKAIRLKDAGGQNRKSKKSLANGAFDKEKVLNYVATAGLPDPLTLTHNKHYV